MQIPHFTLLSPKGWCQSCFNSAHEELGAEAGQVCVHSNGAGQWLCVYCGLPAQRLSFWLPCIVASVRDWLGWLRWEFLMWRLGF
jgi:hypothetical protein